MIPSYTPNPSANIGAFQGRSALTAFHILLFAFAGVFHVAQFRVQNSIH